jgi:hypothetical protein
LWKYARATDSEKGVIPAKAGIQVDLVFPAQIKMDSRFRGNDGSLGAALSSVERLCG